MDPEQVKRLVDRCFERMVEVVAEFGGRVDKILGDGMLVLFGAPVAHEDDPERAVRAALRMQDDARRARGRQRPAHGIDEIRMRIGINTGEVLVGTLAGTDYTAMGDVVNLASRLQADGARRAACWSARPRTGSRRTRSTTSRSATCSRAVASSRCTPGSPMEPTAPPGARRRRRRDVPFVGRSRELAMADAALRPRRSSTAAAWCCTCSARTASARAGSSTR